MSYRLSAPGETNGDLVILIIAEWDDATSPVKWERAATQHAKPKGKKPQISTPYPAPETANLTVIFGLTRK